MSALTDRFIAYGCKIEEAMGRFLDDEDFYGKCFAKFVEDKSFAGLGEALAAGDAAEAFDCIHDLKGISANMGITPIGVLIAPLVEELRHGNIPEDADEVYEELLRIQRDLQGFDS